MSDAQWLRHWCSQHVRATVGAADAKAQALASRAEAAAARDGFSLDDAVRAEGHSSVADYMLGVLSLRASAKARRANVRT